MSGFYKKLLAYLSFLTLLLSYNGFAFAQTAPGTVDMIIEPMSYTPAFYKGRSLFINQGTARIIAIPNITVNGKRLDVKNLTFKWTKDDIVLSTDTITGNNVITINGSVPIRDINIDVQALDSSGNVLAQNSRTLSTNDPKVLFYENSPLYGVLFNRAISANYSLGGREELNIIAKPYFFDVSTQDSDDLDYKWSVNGNPVVLSGPKNEFLLKRTASGAGSASVSLDVSNLVRIFQFTNSSFNLTFGQ